MPDNIITVEVTSLFNPGMIQAIGEGLRLSFGEQMAASARDQWIKLAQESLGTTRRTYQNSIFPVEVNGETYSIALVGQEANAIEHGTPGYDMHDTLLGPNVPVVARGSGDKGKHKKKDGGFYRSIPFRHAGTGTKGAVGPAMASQHRDSLGKEQAEALGKTIYSFAKQLKVSTRDNPQGKTQWGGRLKAGLAPKLQPHHHSDIFAGMVKMKKNYEKTSGFQYGTFRTISTGSPGWIVKAHPGAELMPKVQTFLNQNAQRFLNMMLKASIGGGNAAT